MKFTIHLSNQRCGQAVKAINNYRGVETNRPLCLKPVFLKESRPAGLFAILLLPLLVLLTACGSKESVKSLKEKAQAGDAQAQYDLGVAYADGKGVPKDEVEAVKWYRKAAEQGDASAQNNLGQHVCQWQRRAKR